MFLFHNTLCPPDDVQGIETCSLSPGFVLTPMTERFINSSGPTGAKEICREQQLGHGHPDAGASVQYRPDTVHPLEGSGPSKRKTRSN